LLHAIEVSTDWALLSSLCDNSFQVTSLPLYTEAFESNPFEKTNHLFE